MKEVIGVGSNLDDATQKALVELGAKREEVEIEPLHAGSSGFLGIFGKKPAKVRAMLREDDRIRTIIFLRNILQRMGIESNVQVQEDEQTITVILDGAASALIGHRGQTLDSLQYLIARYLNDEKEDWRKVVVDIDNYRDRREDNLKGLAQRLASQAIRNRRNIKTEPLSAPERRIIHMALKENSEVTTYSIGSGNRKRVVITSNTRSDNRRRPSGGERPPQTGGGGGRSSKRSSSGPRPGGNRRPSGNRTSPRDK